MGQAAGCFPARGPPSPRVTAFPIVVIESEPFTTICGPEFSPSCSHIQLPGCPSLGLFTSLANSPPGHCATLAGWQSPKPPGRAAQSGAGPVRVKGLAFSASHCPLPAMSRPHDCLRRGGISRVTQWLETLLAQVR